MTLLSFQKLLRNDHIGVDILQRQRGSNGREGGEFFHRFLLVRRGFYTYDAGFANHVMRGGAFFGEQGGQKTQPKRDGGNAAGGMANG